MSFGPEETAEFLGSHLASSLSNLLLGRRQTEAETLKCVLTSFHILILHSVPTAWNWKVLDIFCYLAVIQVIKMLVFNREVNKQSVTGRSDARPERLTVSHFLTCSKVLILLVWASTFISNPVLRFRCLKPVRNGAVHRYLTN